MLFIAGTWQAFMVSSEALRAQLIMSAELADPGLEVIDALLLPRRREVMTARRPRQEKAGDCAQQLPKTLGKKARSRAKTKSTSPAVCMTLCRKARASPARCMEAECAATIK